MPRKWDSCVSNFLVHHVRSSGTVGLVLCEVEGCLLILIGSGLDIGAGRGD